MGQHLGRGQDLRQPLLCLGNGSSAYSVPIEIGTVALVFILTRFLHASRSVVNSVPSGSAIGLSKRRLQPGSGFSLQPDLPCRHRGRQFSSRQDRMMKPPTINDKVLAEG